MTKEEKKENMNPFAYSDKDMDKLNSIDISNANISEAIEKANEEHKTLDGVATEFTIVERIIADNKLGVIQTVVTYDDEENTSKEHSDISDIAGFLDYLQRILVYEDDLDSMDTADAASKHIMKNMKIHYKIYLEHGSIIRNSDGEFSYKIDA